MKAAEGFTLIEALLAATILAVVIGAITMPFVAAAQNDEANARLALAAACAEGLMEEILSKPVEDPDGTDEAAGAPRSSWDNVLDYHGLVEEDGEIVFSSGEQLVDPMAAGLRRETAAVAVYLPDEDTSGPASTVIVTIVVYHNTTPLVTLTRLVRDMDF
jgi:hypothetical protein